MASFFFTPTTFETHPPSGHRNIVKNILKKSRPEKYKIKVYRQTQTDNTDQVLFLLCAEVNYNIIEGMGETLYIG
jgi:hypothetical protein